MRLSENAFYLLGTSPYEQKHKIIDKCKDKLFEEDDDGVDYEAHPANKADESTLELVYWLDYRIKL